MNRRERWALFGGVFILAMILVAITLFVLGAVTAIRLTGSSADSGADPNIRQPVIRVVDLPSPTPTPQPAAPADLPPPPENRPGPASPPTDTIRPSEPAPLPSPTPVPTQPPPAEPSTPNAPASIAKTAPPATPPPAPTPSTEIPAAAPPISSPLPTPTPRPTATPSPVPADTPTPRPTATATPVPGRIAGRLVNNGAPVAAAILRLEDESLAVVAETTVVDGIFEFANLPPSDSEYTVLFSQDWNPQLAGKELISWGWLGRVPVQNGTVVTLPDFDIAAQGFHQLAPDVSREFQAAAVSGASPITFEWQPYPNADTYWVDVARNPQTVIWHSPLTTGTTATFDGVLADGSTLRPGEYWWGVGARRQLGSYSMTAYGYLLVLNIDR